MSVCIIFLVAPLTFPPSPTDILNYSHKHNTTEWGYSNRLVDLAIYMSSKDN